MELSDECWWVILHNGHLAWYQRGMMAGDFKPGLQPRSEYIVDAAGRCADPASVPRCVTCDQVPNVDDLEPVERKTGHRGFLVGFRQKLRPWPRPTSDATCWYCNCPGELVADGSGLCAGCSKHLQTVDHRRTAEAQPVPEQAEEMPPSPIHGIGEPWVDKYAAESLRILKRLERKDE